MKRVYLAVCLLFLSAGIRAQERVFEMLPGEKWWGVATDLGSYLVEQAKMGAQTGEPIVRSMEYAFPGQGFESCTDQYMLGDRYLVAPMLTPGHSRTVKLPKGRWQDETGKTYKGGRTYELEVPLDQVPRFTRK
jgi:alpha-glucosidase